MGSPKENEVGYNRSSVVQKAFNFPHDKLHLIHGTADGNYEYIENKWSVSSILFLQESCLTREDTCVDL